MMQTYPKRVQQAVIAIAPEIQRRIDWNAQGARNERQLWNEISCCILSSQVPYATALAAARQLDGAGVLFDPLLQQRETVESRVKRLLNTPMAVNGRLQRYRFPVSRAMQIAGAWSAVRQESGTLSELIGSGREPEIVRDWLVRHVPGLGPKQASMFLRNVAASYDMAVIDRHVLRYMSITGLCSDSTDLRITTLGNYKDLEVRLRNSAKDLGYALGVMDWAIWIVMRLVNRDVWV